MSEDKGRGVGEGIYRSSKRGGKVGVGTLNVGIMIGKGRKVADVMEKKDAR